MTLTEFKITVHHSGDSTIGAAFIAQQVIDDPELQKKAKELIRLEDEFEAMLVERGIER